MFSGLPQVIKVVQGGTNKNIGGIVSTPTASSIKVFKTPNTDAAQVIHTLRYYLFYMLFLHLSLQYFE